MSQQLICSAKQVLWGYCPNIYIFWYPCLFIAVSRWDMMKMVLNGYDTDFFATSSMQCNTKKLLHWCFFCCTTPLCNNRSLATTNNIIVCTFDQSYLCYCKLTLFDSSHTIQNKFEYRKQEPKIILICHWTSKIIQFILFEMHMDWPDKYIFFRIISHLLLHVITDFPPERP